jgi:hypothetical protein
MIVSRRAARGCAIPILPEPKHLGRSIAVTIDTWTRNIAASAVGPDMQTL